MRRATRHSSAANSSLRHFYPRSPCGERRYIQLALRSGQYISIHALLAESDPTTVQNIELGYISIHALLAESDLAEVFKLWRESHFYPRSPCGERPIVLPARGEHHNFYPRSPCGERPTITGIMYSDRKISIHALLAESDWRMPLSYAACQSFLSTLSLRRATYRVPHYKATPAISIHALLAESDTGRAHRGGTGWNFYPRSPCGERPHANGSKYYTSIFLSTLSLRRATRHSSAANSSLRHFYPRSPCGERRYIQLALRSGQYISIHALLAESDPTTVQNIELGYISIHALLAESDLAEVFKLWRESHFYPRSPCGERHGKIPRCSYVTPISIHALLAESDQKMATAQAVTDTISIHALLAESDIALAFQVVQFLLFLSTLSLRRATWRNRHHHGHHHPNFYPRSPCGERL